MIDRDASFSNSHMSPIRLAKKAGIPQNGGMKKKVLTQVMKLI